MEYQHGRQNSFSHRHPIQPCLAPVDAIADRLAIATWLTAGDLLIGSLAAGQKFAGESDAPNRAQPHPGFQESLLTAMASDGRISWCIRTEESGATAICIHTQFPNRQIFMRGATE
jgi:hypothetical protein